MYINHLLVGIIKEDLCPLGSVDSRNGKGMLLNWMQINEILIFTIYFSLMGPNLIKENEINN